MKRFLPFFILIFLFYSLYGSEKNLRTITHESRYLKKSVSFIIYLPNDYQTTQKHYPVLYLLHGAYGCYRDWVEKTDVENLADHYDFILVFPDGNPFGWYVDSPLDSASQYESYIVKELIPYVDHHFRTRADRWHRGICGLSMGGHGAISLAEKHPDLFGSASSLSGILDITQHPHQWHIADRLGPYSEFPKRWKANSCYYLAPKLVGAHVALLFDVGRSDFSYPENVRFHLRLDSLGVKHIFEVYEGSHNWTYWGRHIGEHLAFHNKIFLEKKSGEVKISGRIEKEGALIALLVLFYLLYQMGRKKSRSVRERRREVLDRIKKNRERR
ncbi:MAG: esterase family protein [Calditrichaeota bacterium]|nr:esterase family protein [Calditrichota bacterium]